MTGKSFDDVQKEEYPYIHARRDSVAPDPTKIDKPDNLVGLAFSGGGIRSATFGLGVLEALKEKGLLKKIDYLSTVSGGGYIGAWLSANCHRHGNEWLDQSAKQKEWTDSIKHLRRYSNYLSPNLSLLSADTWSMVTIWLRNTLLLQLMIITAIACLLLLPRLAAPLINFGSNELLRIATFLLFTYLVVWIALNLKNIKEGEEKTDDCKSSAKNNEEEKKSSFSKASQETVQYHVIILMLVGLGFSALLWTNAAENRSFGDCITYIFSNEKPFWFFLLLPYAALVLLSAYSSRKHINSFLVAIPASAVLYLLLATVLYFLGDWKILLDDNKSFFDAGGDLLAFAWAPPMVLGALSLAINVLIGMQGNGSFEYVREWWSRFGAWLAIYGFAWMLVVTIAFYGPLWSAMLYYEGSWKTLSSGWLGTTLAGLFAGKSASTSGTSNNDITTKLKEVLAKVAPFVFIVGLVIVVSMVLHLVISINSSDIKPTQSTLLGSTVQDFKQIALQLDAKADAKTVHFDLAAEPKTVDSPLPRYLTHWQLLAAAKCGIVWGAFGVCLFCVGVLSWRIDINEFSLNAFYRNRLARCYLGATRMSIDRKPHDFTGFDHDDDLELAGLLDSKKTPFGPLHIINCALNLGGSSDLSMHTRHSAVFTLTPLYCGSHYEVKKQNGTVDYPINYSDTKSYGGNIQPTTLGQAISVSGAAASPNMGYHTSAPVAFLMTLFNARLGWWFPNPSKFDCQQSSPTFSLWYLIKELFGGADEKSNFLAISDGGHFENLAAYELVKRQCKVIIISDGECDPKLQFEGLATLIRMCEVDGLVKKIDIDVSAIHPENESGWSGSCCAIGKIIYGADKNGKAIPDGWLIYIKASMDGHEDTAVTQYKAAHPDFPHETTGDQFYAEDQFESYRALGRSITKEAVLKIEEDKDNDELQNILQI